MIEPALQAAETARLAARPTADLTAYDLYLRGTIWGAERESPQFSESNNCKDPLYYR